MALLAVLGLCAVLGHADTELHDEESFLLQVHARVLPQERIDVSSSLPHYWPHVRGSLDQLSITQYPMVIPPSGNLSDSLLWSHDMGGLAVVWNIVIDHEKNIYVGEAGGLVKLSPEGQVLWTNREGSFYAVLMGNAVCSQTTRNGRWVYCLSQKTGRQFWKRRVYPVAGIGGNMIEGYRGVLLVAAGEFYIENLNDLTGKANDRVIALNASTGDELWQFKVECGMWVLMALFPDSDTTVFQDQCGGVYRLGLFNGSRLWYAPGTAGTLSDGSAILGPDGSAYACAMPEGSELADNIAPLHPGIVRKFRVSDGALLWSAETPYPCTNIGAVTADGRTFVVAPGAIPAVDGPFWYYRKEIKALPAKERRQLHRDYDAMMRNDTLRNFFNMEDLTGAIMGLDTQTGAVQWRHEVKPSGSITAAGDQERNWNYWIRGPKMFLTGHVSGPHCGPAHWSSPTLDMQGNVYIGDSVGEIRVYSPRLDKELDFHTDDGIMPPGAASAPGMMVFTTCQTVYAFKAKGG